MPFIGQDWRCPGANWVKCEEFGGKWENAKICRQRMFASMNENLMKRAFRQSLLLESGSSPPQNNDFLSTVSQYQPCVQMRTVASREDVTLTPLTEALVSLDFKSGIKDTRRFNYICKIVQLLVADKFQSLSGRCQMFIVELLKDISREVLRSGNQFEVLRTLLNCFSNTLDQHKHNHIGGSQLWKNHRTVLQELSVLVADAPAGRPCPKNAEQILSSNVRLRTARSAQVDSISGPDSSLKFMLLPSECLDRILLNLSCPQDLETAGMVTPFLSSLVNDDLLWKRIVLSNFSHDQLRNVQWGLPGWRWADTDLQQDAIPPNVNWKRAYRRLLNRYGDQHFYPAKLAICSRCSSLFWRVLGHPCLEEVDSQKAPEEIRELTAEQFIALFPL